MPTSSVRLDPSAAKRVVVRSSGIDGKLASIRSPIVRAASTLHGSPRKRSTEARAACAQYIHRVRRQRHELKGRNSAAGSAETSEALRDTRRVGPTSVVRRGSAGAQLLERAARGRADVVAACAVVALAADGANGGVARWKT